MGSSVRALLDVPWPQGKPHLCLGIRLVHLSSVTDFCLGTGDPHSPGTPLTFLRDYGVNSAVQEYPFFMLISFLFKENGPENSVILDNDTIAISQQGQALPFDCTEKKREKKQMEKGRESVAWPLQPQRFCRWCQHAALRADLTRAGCHFPGG